MSALIPIKFPQSFAVGQAYTAPSGKRVVWQDATHLSMDGNLLLIDSSVSDDSGITFYVDI